MSYWKGKAEDQPWWNELNDTHWPFFGEPHVRINYLRAINVQFWITGLHRDLEFVQDDRDRLEDENRELRKRLRKIQAQVAKALPEEAPSDE